MIAVGLVRAYLARGSYHGLYYSIEKPLKFFQTGALLEVSRTVIASCSTTHLLHNECIRFSLAFRLLAHFPTLSVCLSL